MLATRLRGLLLWDGPRRSLGKNERLTFTGYFDARVVSDLDVQLYIRGLRSKAELHGALIGPQGLFNDRAALLMEFGHVSAVQDVLDSIDGLAATCAHLDTTPSRTLEPDTHTADNSGSDHSDIVQTVETQPARREAVG